MALMSPLAWARTYALVVHHMPSLRAQLRRATDALHATQSALRSWDDCVATMAQHNPPGARHHITKPMAEYRDLLVQDMADANEAIGLINTAIVEELRGT